MSADPFGELKPSRLPLGLLQRFPDRVLVMTTDRCFGYCPHCTRRFILGKARVVDTPERLAACVKWVKAHPQVRDVLLSGGDVLTLPDAQVLRLVRAFAALEQVEVIRLCTRALVAKPSRLTAGFAAKLARAGRGKLWANVHVNTAEEALLARKPAARLVNRGIPVSSQTVLLKGVNDTAAKMIGLLRALSAGRIRPYYVFMCDPVRGLERWRVPLAKARALEKACAEAVGGLSLPRFVRDVPGARRKLPL